MKNIIVFLFVLFGITACEKGDFSRQESADKSRTEVSFRDWPTIIFGTRSKPCGSNDDCYCTGERGICLIINPKKIAAAGIPTYDFDENEGAATISFLTPSKMFLEIIEDNSIITLSDSIFKVYDDVLLDSIFDQPITILAGEYRMNYSTNPLGNVILDIQ